MLDDEKAPYISLAIEDHKRHLIQQEDLKEKGYFTMSDGRKSTDLEEVQKKPLLGKRPRNHQSELPPTTTDASAAVLVDETPSTTMVIKKRGRGRPPKI